MENPPFEDVFTFEHNKFSFFFVILLGGGKKHSGIQWPFRESSTSMEWRIDWPEGNTWFNCWKRRRIVRRMEVLIFVCI